MQIGSKLKIISFSLFIFWVTLSCKKKNVSQPPPQNNPIANSPYSVSTVTVFSGFFSSVKRTEYYNKTKIINSNVTLASFFSSPVSIVNNSGIRINSLYHSGQTMNYDTTWKNYGSYEAFNFNSELWQVMGANGIPSFNFWNNIVPSCDNFNTLPDSVSVSAGFTFSINNVTNVTTNGLELQIYDGTTILLNSIKPIFNGNNVITVTPIELTNVSLDGEGLIVYISLTNVQDLNFYGSNFRFSKANQFSKKIKVYP